MEKHTKFSSSINFIPLDIWIEITSSFSVKSLINLSAVNKHLLSIIKDPAFITAHLRRPNSCNQLLTYVDKSHGVVFAIRDIEHDFLACVSGEVDDVVFIEYIPLADAWSGDRVIKPGIKEFKRNKVQWDVVCSLEGLVVLSRGANATLWNPSTRKHRKLKLPEPGIELYFGIGYRFDPLCNDYKLVALRASKDEAWIYTVRTKSWTPITSRRFNNHNSKIYAYSTSLSLKHTIVWVEIICDISSPPTQRLLLFHFETETFRHTNPPYSINGNLDNHGLTLLDGGSSIGWWAGGGGGISIWALDTNTMDWAVRYKLGPMWMGYKVVERAMFEEMDGALVWRFWGENGSLKFMTFSFDIERQIYRIKSEEAVGECLDIYHGSLVVIN